MGRPKTPRISRERAARAALDVVDVHGLNGLNGLSLELVARQIGVKAPSLYYHFKDKSELLSEVALLIMHEIKVAFSASDTCAYHAVGSCRMDKDPAQSVVDPQLRVRAVEGLRVLDTSIMPARPSGNTNGPSMAMAWRAADIMLRDAPLVAGAK